jgi:hypothetical protein
MQFQVGQTVRSPDGQAVAVRLAVAIGPEQLFYCVELLGSQGTTWLLERELASWQAVGGPLPHAS